MKNLKSITITIQYRSMIFQAITMATLLFGLATVSLAQTGVVGTGGSVGCGNHDHAGADNAVANGCGSHTHPVTASNVSGLQAEIDNIVNTGTAPASSDPDGPDPTPPSGTEPIDNAGAVAAANAELASQGINTTNICAQDYNTPINVVDGISLGLQVGATIADGIALAAEAGVSLIPLFGSAASAAPIALQVGASIANGVALGFDVASYGIGIAQQNADQCSFTFQGDVTVVPETRAGTSLSGNTATPGNITVQQGDISATLGDVNAGDTLSAEGDAIVIGVEGAAGAAPGIAIGGGAITGAGNGTIATNTNSNGVAIGNGATTAGAAVSIGTGNVANGNGAVAGIEQSI